MEFELQPSLADRLDFARAATEEGSAPITFLPSRVLESVLAQNPEPFAEHVDAQARSCRANG